MRAAIYIYTSFTGGLADGPWRGIYLNAFGDAAFGA